MHEVPEIRKRWQLDPGAVWKQVYRAPTPRAAGRTENHRPGLACGGGHAGPRGRCGRTSPWARCRRRPAAARLPEAGGVVAI